MNSDRIKAVIIHSDFKLAKEIQTEMPDYIDVSFSRFSNAKEKLAEGTDGEKIGLVIMGAEEDDGKDLTLYKYIKQDPDKIGLRKIPVILLAADEFSTHSLEFFDIADPVFYTGDIADSDFFMTINDVLDEAELHEDDDFDTDETESEETPKSSEKLMGAVYSIDTSMPESRRIAAYDNANLKEALIKAVSENKEKAKQIYEVLESIASEKKAKGEPVDFSIGKDKDREPKAVEKTPISQWKKKQESLASLHKINDIKRVSELLTEEPEIKADISAKGADARNTGFYAKKNVVQAPQSSSGQVLKQAAGPMQKQVQQRAQTPVNTGNRQSKNPVILIVDSDPNTLKAFKLFLGEGYRIEMVESSMKALDFVVKNKVDIVAIDYVLQGMSGLSVLKSIKNQPAGMNAKVFIFMQENSPQAVMDKVYNTPGVAGVIKKPIIKKKLLSVINRA